MPFLPKLSLCLCQRAAHCYLCPSTKPFYFPCMQRWMTRPHHHHHCRLHKSGNAPPRPLLTVYPTSKHALRITRRVPGRRQCPCQAAEPHKRISHILFTLLLGPPRQWVCLSQVNMEQNPLRRPFEDQKVLVTLPPRDPRPRRPNSPESRITSDAAAVGAYAGASDIAILEPLTSPPAALDVRTLSSR